jgi:hypothetical protein
LFLSRHRRAHRVGNFHLHLTFKRPAANSRMSLSFKLQLQAKLSGACGGFAGASGTRRSNHDFMALAQCI